MAKGRKKEPMTPEERLQAALVPESERPYKVPGNWCWVYWGVCGDFRAGSAFKNEYQGLSKYEIPFYKVGSLKYSDSNGILYDTSNTINEEIRSKLKAVLIPENSIIFAKIGEAIRLNRRSISPVACCIDNNLMSFCAKACLTKYVYFWSLGIDLYNYTNATTVPAIRKSDLERVPFPLAPCVEQQRIVDRIESLFAKLDEARQKAQDALDSVELRKAAILHKAFTGELTAPWRKEHGVRIGSWENSTVGRVCQDVKVGIVIKPSQYYTDPENGTPAFRSANVRENHIDDFDWVYLNHVGMENNSRSIVHTGDVLVVRSGNPGTSCVVSEKFDGYNAIDILIAVPDHKKISSDFLSAYTNSPFGKRLIFESKRGMALAHFNVKGYSELPIKVPPIHEQLEIVRLLDDLLAKEQQAKDTAQKVLEQIDLIKKAVLARAFRGELGTNDPNEESAAEWLKQMV